MICLDRLSACFAVVPLLVAQEPRDPAPPSVRKLEPVAAPVARATAELRFHRAPRALASAAVVEDWPDFRGPRRDGICRETKLATEFGAGGPPLVWELDTGASFASPIVAQGKLVFTYRAGRENRVDALEPETGRLLWRHVFPCEYVDRYNQNDGPRATPVVAPALGEFPAAVYVHGVQGELFCLELASGRVLWQRNTSQEWDVPQDFFGLVSTPLVRGEQLIVNVGAPKGPSVIALDRRTGKLAWASDGPAWGASCASPVLATLGGRERLLVLAGGDSRPPTGGLLALDPETGKLQHSYAFRSRTYESVLAANPLALGERVFISSSYSTGSACLEVKSDGTLKELWTDRHLGLQFSNPLALDGKIVLIDGVHDRAGALVVLDPASGKTLSRTELVWDEELERNGQKTTIAFTPGEGSLLAVGERLLCLGDSGHLLWLALTAEGATITSRARLFRANEAWTPPIVSHGLLYVVQTKKERDGGHGPRLLCYDLRAE